MYTRVLPRNESRITVYLCVNHGNDGAIEVCIFRSRRYIYHRANFLFSSCQWEVLLAICCTMDYILHTVDSATALLNSPLARTYDKAPIFSLYTLIHSFSQTSDPCHGWYKVLHWHNLCQ